MGSQSEAERRPCIFKEGKVQPVFLRVMDPVPIKFEDFSEAIADLKATKFKRFKDNFLWVW
jgi:hypothetical protein